MKATARSKGEWAQTVADGLAAPGGMSRLRLDRSTVLGHDAGSYWVDHNDDGNFRSASPDKISRERAVEILLLYGWPRVSLKLPRLPGHDGLVTQRTVLS